MDLPRPDGAAPETISAVKVRPELKRMMLAAHAGTFDTLIVWALDRLGRSMAGNLQTVLELDRLGVRVVSVREPWLDTSGPVRSLLIAIFGWVAEQERLRIVERTKAGIARARHEGKHVGRPAAHVDLDEALRLRRRGTSIREAARRLGVGASTLQRAYAAHDAVTAASGRVPHKGRGRRPILAT
jgi:DNA invertase Pin-like site-specific DNA recombinase